MASTNSHQEIPRVTYGFIGLGNMGYSMASNLRKHMAPECALVVCEIVKPTRQKFLEETKGRVEAVETPKEVAEKADIIITMLPVGRHVKEVFQNPVTGLLALPSTTSPKLFIECSTIDVKSSTEVLESVQASGLGRFCDAPVSGGPTGAQAGTLTFMCGGPDDVMAEIKPIVLTMGKTFYHCGGPTAGLATKQINNYISGICMLGTAEAMNLGIKYGLDPKKLAGVINTSTGRSYNSIEQNPVKGISPNSTAEIDFARGFAIELGKGVMDMAVELGESVGARMPLAKGLIDTFGAACADPRCKGKDIRSVYLYVADIEKQ